LTKVLNRESLQIKLIVIFHFIIYRIVCCVFQDSPNESVIQRDINRTFPAHDFFKESGGLGQDSLYRISKVLSITEFEKLKIFI